MAAGVLELTDSNFDQTIKGSDTPVLVDFWAAWCAPCRRIAPIVEELAGEYSGRLAVAKVDIDANQQVTVQHGVQSIPTMILFHQGREVARTSGAMSAPQIVRWVRDQLSAAAA